MVQLYEWDLGMHRHAPALRMMVKLTEDHISLTPRLRMRVNLAVQVTYVIFYKFKVSYQL